MRWFFDTSQAVSTAAGTLSGNASEASNSTANPQTGGEEEMSISQMAGLFGITMRTLRFYESKGLLSPRRIGNRRFYDDACAARLRLIMKGKAMGLGLDEIGELVALVESDLSDAERAQTVRTLCERQRDLLIARRDAINEQIDETDRVIEGLTAL